MKLRNSVILFYIISIAFPGEAYRILGIFPYNGKSHFVMFERLMKGLAERGHQVDVVSHFPLKKPFPNYNDVVSLVGTLPDMVNNVTMDFIKSADDHTKMPNIIASTCGNNLCKLMNHPGLKDLIENPPKNPPYDLLITEVFGAHCYLALGQHLKVPVVGMISAVMFSWANDFIANPDGPAYIPNEFSDFNGRMNFLERVQNTVINFHAKYVFDTVTDQQTDDIKKNIGPHAPGVREAERNLSLILVNSHYSLNGVRPFTTGVIEVGGLHIDDREATLPDDLQKWLDESKDGFVYISFGSMIKIEALPKEFLTALYTSIAKLAPIRVLMKIVKPEELPPGLPSEVITRPWISQLAVLKHKNIRAFVTHGGLMGTQEAIYYGVPMIGIPFFGDQIQNIKVYSQMNLAETIDFKKPSVEKIDAAFNAVLRDPSYMKAVKKLSALFRDRPMSALDTAVFWIEYVIRNGGTVLRSPAMDLAWWQIALLDVYGFLLLCIILVTYLIIAIIRILKAIFCQSSVKTMLQSKKVN